MRGDPNDLDPSESTHSPLDKPGMKRMPTLPSSVTTSDWSHVGDDDLASSTDRYGYSIVPLDALSPTASDPGLDPQRAPRAAEAAHGDSRRSQIDAAEKELALRAATDALARVQSENASLRAVLQMRTIERSLPVSAAILKSAQDVQRLMDDLSTKETLISMLGDSSVERYSVTWGGNEAADSRVQSDSPSWLAAPSGGPASSTLLTTNSHGLPTTRLQHETEAQYSARLLNKMGNAERHLTASRLLEATRAMRWARGDNPTAMVERMLANPGLCPCDPAILERPDMAATLKFIADDHTLTWKPVAEVLARVVHFACSVWGMTANMETYLENNRAYVPHAVAPGDLLTYLNSSVVNRMLDAVVDEAHRVVATKLPRSRSIRHLWDAVERSNPMNNWLMLADVRWDVAKEDVRELLLRPGFIEISVNLEGITAAQTRSESPLPWPAASAPATGPSDKASPPNVPTTLLHDLPALEESLQALMKDQKPKLNVKEPSDPHSAEVASLVHGGRATHASASPDLERFEMHEDDSIEASLATAGTSRYVQVLPETPIAETPLQRSTMSSEPTPATIDQIPIRTGPTEPPTEPTDTLSGLTSDSDNIRPAHISKNKWKKTMKRARNEALKAEKAAARAAAASDDSGGHKGEAPINAGTSWTPSGSSSIANPTQDNTWLAKARRATTAELEEASNIYARMRQEAAALLQALLERHKVIAQLNSEELQLQEKGFYRLSKEEMDIMREYPEVVTIEGETFVLSSPLPERGAPGNGKGRATESGHADLEAFWRERNSELGKNVYADSDASTEIGIEYVDDDDDVAVGGDEEALEEE